MNQNDLVYKNLERTVSQNLHNYLLGDGETPYLKSIDQEPIKDSIMNSIFNQFELEDSVSPLPTNLQLDRNKSKNSGSLGISIGSLKMF